MILLRDDPEFQEEEPRLPDAIFAKWLSDTRKKMEHSAPSLGDLPDRIKRTGYPSKALELLKTESSELDELLKAQSSPLRQEEMQKLLRRQAEAFPKRVKALIEWEFGPDESRVGGIHTPISHPRLAWLLDLHWFGEARKAGYFENHQGRYRFYALPVEKKVDPLAFWKRVRRATYQTTLWLALFAGAIAGEVALITRYPPSGSVSAPWGEGTSGSNGAGSLEDLANNVHGNNVAHFELFPGTLAVKRAPTRFYFPNQEEMFKDRSNLYHPSARGPIAFQIRSVLPVTIDNSGRLILGWAPGFDSRPTILINGTRVAATEYDTYETSHGILWVSFKDPDRYRGKKVTLSEAFYPNDKRTPKYRFSDEPIEPYRESEKEKLSEHAAKLQAAGHHRWAEELQKLIARKQRDHSPLTVEEVGDTFANGALYSYRSAREEKPSDANNYYTAFRKFVNRRGETFGQCNLQKMPRYLLEQTLHSRASLFDQVSSYGRDLDSRYLFAMSAHTQIRYTDYRRNTQKIWDLTPRGWDSESPQKPKEKLPPGPGFPWHELFEKIPDLYVEKRHPGLKLWHSEEFDPLPTQAELDAEIESRTKLYIDEKLPVLAKAREEGNLYLEETLGKARGALATLGLAIGGHPAAFTPAGLPHEQAALLYHLARHYFERTWPEGYELVERMEALRFQKIAKVLSDPKEFHRELQIRLALVRQQLTDPPPGKQHHYPIRVCVATLDLLDALAALPDHGFQDTSRESIAAELTARFAPIAREEVHREIGSATLERYEARRRKCRFERLLTPPPG
jgi:hypothetical protein